MPDLAEVAEVAEQLYALPPEEFVAARAERVKLARAVRDRALATAVSRLPKPTTAAWLLNCLVRERPERVRELISLGDALREAQQNLSGPALRQLSRQRHELIAAFTSMALAPAEGAGRAVSAQVQETLGAAIADPEAGQALLSGRLTKGLSYVGLGDVDPARSGPAEPTPARKQSAGKDASRRDTAERARRVHAAKDEVTRVEKAARAAAREREDAQEEADRAAATVDALRARVAELGAGLATAEEELAHGESEVRALAARSATAQEQSDAAETAVEEARKELAAAQA